MSPYSNPTIDHSTTEGTRARANTDVSTIPGSSTMRSIASNIPSTPITPQDNDTDVDEEQAESPDDVGHLATPQHPHPPPSSIAINRTLDLVDQVGDIEEPKVPHQLAAPGQIQSGDNPLTHPAVVAQDDHHQLNEVEANDQTEGVQPSPNSDPFEFDDNFLTQSSVPTREPVDHSDLVEENDDTDDVEYSTFSDQSESGSSFSTNITTAHLEENDNSNVVEQLPTSDQSDSTGSLPTDPTTVEPTPTLTPLAEFALDQFDALVRALTELSPPFTFDGDIVMPDGQDLKLYVCEKGYDASFKHEEDDEDDQTQHIDESKEKHYDIRRLKPRVWNDIVNFGPINLALGDASQEDKAYREMKADQFSLKPDLIAASGIMTVIKQQLKQQANLSLDTSHATLRVCTVGAWNGTDVSSILANGSRIGTIVLGLPVLSETGDTVVRHAAKSLQGKVVFDWSKQWMSQHPADVRPRWMYFPSGTRYTIENICDDKRRESGKDDVHFVIEYPVYVDGPVKRAHIPSRSGLTKTLVEALRTILSTATRDYQINFILSRPAAKRGRKSRIQLENELDDRHSTQPDAVLYKALKDLHLVPTFEHVNDEPINPVPETYPKVKSTVGARFPVRVRDEAKRVISLTYNDSKPTVLIGAPILDDAENVGGRVVMTVDIPKSKELVGGKED